MQKRITLNPTNEGYRLLRGQVASHVVAKQPPRFEVGVGVTTPTRPGLGLTGGVMPGGAIVIPSGRLAVVRAGWSSPTSDGRSRSVPDLWDTNPHNVFSTPDQQPDPAPRGHDDDHTKEVVLEDHRGHLRPPAYLLITLVGALAVVLLLTVTILVVPG